MTLIDTIFPTLLAIVLLGPWFLIAYLIIRIRRLEANQEVILTSVGEALKKGFGDVEKIVRANVNNVNELNAAIATTTKQQGQLIESVSSIMTVVFKEDAKTRDMVKKGKGNIRDMRRSARLEKAPAVNEKTTEALPTFEELEEQLAELQRGFAAKEKRRAAKS